MSYMDGHPVEVGDRVWDSRDGHGVVQAVFGNTFAARFSGRRRSVGYDGVMDGRASRTVFWAPNDLFVPSKNPAVYTKQRRAVRQIMGIIADLTDEPVMAVDRDVAE